MLGSRVGESASLWELFLSLLWPVRVTEPGSTGFPSEVLWALLSQCRSLKLGCLLWDSDPLFLREKLRAVSCLPPHQNYGLWENFVSVFPNCFEVSFSSFAWYEGVTQLVWAFLSEEETFSFFTKCSYRFGVSVWEVCLASSQVAILNEDPVGTIFKAAYHN